VIDLHSHILPGIDDGADSLDTSLEMARAAVEDGVTAIAATPHVRDDWPTAPQTMERLVADLRAAVAEEGIPLEVLTGAELAFERLPQLDDEALRRFGLGGNPACLLVELPHAGWPLSLEESLFDLRVRGFTVVLAHPERSAEVRESPERLERLVEQGVLTQVTAAAVDGRHASRSSRAAHMLIDRGLAHLLASDAHAPSLRKIGLGDAVRALGNPALARWLTEEVPAAVLAGEAIPARPAASGRRRLRWRFRAGEP
jgi:protein-tyrosine phosphatase